MVKARALLLPLLIIMGSSADLWGQARGYVNPETIGWTPTGGGGRALVVSEDYYAPVYVDPVLRYRYPAWQVFGDGWRYKRLGEPGWRTVKVGSQLYVLGGPNCTLYAFPFAYGPGYVASSGRYRHCSGVPVMGPFFTFLVNLAIRF